MTPLDEAIIENDLLPEDQRLTNVELAEKFNTSEALSLIHISEPTRPY